MSPQPSPADPLDFTDQYNTPIPPERQAEYQQWRSALAPQLQSARDYDLQGAFLNGSSPDVRDHMTDQFKKPNHPTFSDASQYNGIDEYVGGKWTDKGYQPSRTNLEFRPKAELQRYFATVEKGTPLLEPESPPVPTGMGGVYRMADLGVSQQPAPYRVKPSPAAAPAPQPAQARRYYGQSQ